MAQHNIVYRPYQIAAHDTGIKHFYDVDSILEVLPTGTGKTVVAGMFAETFVNRGEKTLFLAHRTVLIDQAFKTLNYFGLEVATEMGQCEALSADSEVVVGSIQSLQGKRLLQWPTETFGLIIVDEAHRALADSYTRILNHFSGYKLLGITATPSRGDRRNLGSRFQTKAFEYSMRQAIQDGWIVPIRRKVIPISIDLRGIRTTGGDFNQGDLEARLTPMVEPIARAIVKENGDRPAVAFTPDVGSASFLASTLCELGVNARYVAGSGGEHGQKKSECKQNLQEFDDGKYQVICCCELLAEGWDCLRVETVINLRPTKLWAAFAQRVGRGTRPSPATGKTNCLVLNFAWETDGELDLCTSVDLFDDGQLDPEVYAVAREIADSRSGEIDLMEVIEEAEHKCDMRRRFMIKLTGKEETYKAWEYDPVGVSKILDVKLNRKYDFDKNGYNPATDRQIWKLQSLGVKTPEGLSKWGASKMISKLLKRQEGGLASHGDVHKLMSMGVNPDLARTFSATEAATAITQIQPTQGVFFQ
jgi:superfamily II DNA or RNA helicase